MEKNRELGREFPVVKEAENKSTFKGFIKWLWYKFYLKLPVSKKELYEYLTYTATLVKAVKELEAINRTQITGLLYKINQQSETNETDKNTNGNKSNYRGQYQ